jgi:LmbE family N-acetylglucosaminyl deacetylase
LKEIVRNFLLRLITSFVLKKIKTTTLSHLFEPKSSIMVLAPHPDDEIIGLGGVLLEAIKLECQIHIVFLTDGEDSGAINDKIQVIAERKKLTLNVFNKMGISENTLTRLSLKDGVVPQKQQNGFIEATDKLAALMDEKKPDMIFATHETDFWPYDHVACAQLAVAAREKSQFKPTLYFYWVWSWYHLKPWNLNKLNFSRLRKVLINKHFEQKQVLIKLYIVPRSPTGIPWSGSLPVGMLRPFKKPYEVVEKYE